MILAALSYIGKLPISDCMDKLLSLSTCQMFTLPWYGPLKISKLTMDLLTFRIVGNNHVCGFPIKTNVHAKIQGHRSNGSSCRDGVDKLTD